MNYCFADLHLHTALSPCADESMTPPAIVEKALAEGLGMIAICDHNSARNVAAVQRAAGERLTVLAGVELTSVEECHVVGLFPTAKAAEATAEEAGASLPPVDAGYEAFFGVQSILSADGAVLDSEQRALAMATALDINDTVALVHRHGGIAIAAHIDRKAFGVVSQLGFFPTDAGFDGVELSRHIELGSAEELPYKAHGLPILHSSDAHYLDDIGAAWTALEVEAATYAELVLALRGANGRGLFDA